MKIENVHVFKAKLILRLSIIVAKVLNIFQACMLKFSSAFITKFKHTFENLESNFKYTCKFVFIVVTAINALE